MTSVAVHPPETNGGIVTSWLPLTSTWPSVAECATGGIYSQMGANGALAIAYDPYYGMSIDRSLTCLPPFATAWWSQSTTTPLLTHTSLGPFVCPGGYTTATSSVVNDISTFVGCCPSSYTFEGTKDSGTLGQCNSPLSVGQVLTYIDLTSSLHTASATISSEGASVFGVQLNGYIFAPSSTASSSSSILSLATSTGPTVSPTSSQTPSTGGLSTGVRAAIGVGVSLAVLGLCALFVSLFCIRRYRKKAAASDSGVNFNGSSPPLRNWILKGNDRLERSEMEQPTTRYELAGTLR
ncbi:uncharacterized protein K444DRAFT_664331 [Hyaloscypha bicolor E]|uniref:Uncharacterized protein n=1 Tax=Hyaloscypha bicolor E TaxID=1095630 RepID=A0A2J6T891_9HELO|nr:uncharacterized protein K444DRAFT_664331 [Hyaloscypha bicolor E]PMD59208.1 hypothetical protein K444DRAFT_664331 [Hyaloscypha bicolor E]